MKKTPYLTLIYAFIVSGRADNGKYFLKYFLPVFAAPVEDTQPDSPWCVSAVGGVAGGLALVSLTIPL